MIEKDEWFPDVGEYLPDNPNPLDSMPIAKNPPSWEDTAPSEYEPPMTDSDWFINKPKDNYSSRHKSTPDNEKAAEEIVTMHEKMYRMATKNGGSWLGGSENQQGGSEQRFTPENDPYGGH
jgi:hypothetical protein